MEKKYVIICILSIWLNTISQVYTAGQENMAISTQVAERFISRQKNQTLGMLNLDHVIQIGSMEPYLDCNDRSLIGEIVHLRPRGYLIITGGPAQARVVAYSFQHDWQTDPTGNNPLTDFLTAGLRASKRYRDTDHINSQDSCTSILNRKRTSYQWPEAGSTWTSGWVETTWTQGSPYNDLCPVDTIFDKRSAVGCTMTALTQILNYHKYLGNIRLNETDRYRCKTRQIFVDEDSSLYNFPGFPTLNTFLASLENKYQNNIPLTNLDKAVLSFTAGIVNKIDYTGTCSSVDHLPIMADLIKDKFNYCSADYLDNDEEDFHPLLRENLINGFPAIIFLSDHAVVADGFTTDGFYHINFGWCRGDPAQIVDCWYMPEALPKGYEGFYSGILNIKPQALDIRPQITSSVKSLNFPCTDIGEVSDPVGLSLKNNGDTDIMIDDILVSGNFDICLQNSLKGETPVDLLLQPQEEIKMDVFCMPEAVGQFHGQIQILFSTGKVRKYLLIKLTAFGVSRKGTMIDQTFVSGLWKKSASPYYICNDIHVTPGEKLEIREGSEIYFMGPYQMIIDGDAQLIVAGSVSDSVRFSEIDKESGWHGLFIDNSGSDDTISYCVIRDVDAPWEKTAICVRESSPVICHTTLINNRSAFYAGGICLRNSSVTLSHVNFIGNRCKTRYGAGALYLRKSTAALENILIYNNQARNGAAIYTSQSSCSLKNLTITGNMADELGGAILLSGGNRVTVKNTIFWNNYAPSGSTIAFKKTSGDDTLDFSYSDIDTVKSDWLYHGEYSSEKKLFNWNEGSICKDPLFADEDRSDFTLQKCSPCIDSGDPLADCSMEPQPNGGRINMGAFGGTSLAAVTSLETLLEQPVPEIFSLSQNYPNPFNPLTTINYELPRTNYVDLSIYNLLGQKVATLVNQKQPAGRYQIQWNARGFASGVYYYRLIAGSLVETKKLVLLR